MASNCIIIPPGELYELPADPFFNQVSLLVRARDGLLDLKGNAVFDTKTAPLDSTYAKHGSQSILFDGTSAKSLIASGGNAGVLSDAAGWTLEAWIYLNSATGVRAIVSSQNAANAANAFLMYVTSANKLALSTNVDRAIGSVTLAQNQWNHVAIDKNGATSCTLWVNGAFEVFPGGFGGDFTATGLAIGSRITPGNVPFKGAIDSVRITRARRYTAAFTPAQFSDH